MNMSDSYRSDRAKWPWFSMTTLFLILGCGPPALGEAQQDFLIFTSIDAFKNTSGSTPEVDDSFVRPTLDVLYSYSGDKFKLLGEYTWSSTEAELERLKIGWQTGANTTLWFGRFHATSKFWTTEYHHGQYLQSSITRPSVEEWEDESGPMPSHVTGLSLEHISLLSGDAAVDFGFSVGLSPIFEGEELVPFDLLDPESGHDLSINYRMVYRPNIVSLNQFGFLVGWNEIDVLSGSNPQLADLDQVQQTTVGLFADWRVGPWRLLGNIVYFNNDMQYTDSNVTDEFLSGYLQAEYEISPKWKIFGRADLATGEDDSPYLQLLPAFIAHRNMLGVRWDFVPFQSFTIEIADTSAQGDMFSHEAYKEARIQWSAVIQ